MKQTLHATTADTNPFPAGGGTWSVRCSKCEWVAAQAYPVGRSEEWALYAAHSYGSLHEDTYNQGTS